MSVRNDALKIGHVASADGTAITVEARCLNLEGEVDTHSTAGSFVNCGGDHGDVLCVVMRAWQELADRVAPQDKGQRALTDVKEIDLVAVGTIEGGFRHEVDHLPPDRFGNSSIKQMRKKWGDYRWS